MYSTRTALRMVARYLAAVWTGVGRLGEGVTVISTRSNAVLCLNFSSHMDILSILIGADKPTVFLHLPGMVLQPSLGNSSFKHGFSFNWDCDPIIPISLWASLLITIS